MSQELQKIQNDNIVELINGGDTNAYHLLLIMILNFIQCNPDDTIIYYYPKSNSRLTEMFLDLLPPNFHRHYTKNLQLEYKPFIPDQKFAIERNFVDPEWAYPYQYDFLRNLFKKHFTPKNRPGFYVYISRNSDSKYKRIKNEEDLLKCIRPLGFKEIVLSELSVKKQMKVFAEADIILTPHGAGLTHILFSNPELTVFEITHSNKESKHYWHMAWHFGLDYYRIVAQQDENSDFIVNPKYILNILENHPKIIKKSK
jgi:hypothetical protein